jgi:phasin family protein
MAQRTIYVAVQHKGLHMDADTQASAEAVDTAEAVVEPAKAETPVRKPAAKARRKAKTTRKLVRANERNEEMTKQNDKIFGAFAAFPAAPAFEKLFTEASARGEEAVKRSRKAAEELANLCRGNLDALVESGKELVSKSRDSLEQTANIVRSFTEAKSPTELLQLHSDFARTAFDRFVEESSALTESMVKLAGEAFQPLSNRASANVEKLNQIAA